MGLDLFPVEDFGEGAAFALFRLANGPADRDQADKLQVFGRTEKL